MLSRFENKRIRITTEDESVFTGIAEVLPSGYGLHEFGRAEEGIQINDVIIFLSDIRNIEIIQESEAPAIMPRQFDDLMGKLLEGPYWIVDILPEQVPKDADGQYFSVERYYLQPERIRMLRRKYAEILLRLNCYFDMAVSFDSCESWDKNPDPEEFADRLAGLSGNSFLRAVFEKQRAMIDIEVDETCMTVYDPDAMLLDKVRALASSEGLFAWQPPENGESKGEIV